MNIIRQIWDDFMNGGINSFGAIERLAAWLDEHDTGRELDPDRRFEVVIARLLIIWFVE